MPIKTQELCEKCKAAVMAVRKRQDDEERAFFARATRFPID